MGVGAHEGGHERAREELTGGGSEGEGGADDTVRGDIGKDVSSAGNTETPELTKGVGRALEGRRGAVRIIASGSESRLRLGWASGFRVAVPRKGDIRLDFAASAWDMSDI